MGTYCFLNEMVIAVIMMIEITPILVVLIMIYNAIRQLILKLEIIIVVLVIMTGMIVTINNEMSCRT